MRILECRASVLFFSILNHYKDLNDHFDIFRDDNEVQILDNKLDLKEEKLKTELIYSEFANFKFNEFIILTFSEFNLSIYMYSQKSLFVCLFVRSDL